MFNPPCNLDHLTERFKVLCDAALDLDPQSLADKIPENLMERAHLAVLADMSLVRDCESLAKELSIAEPHQIVNLVIEHHQKITRYLFLRSMILRGDSEDDSDELDTEVF